jgi:hypothetical protein
VTVNPVFAAAFVLLLAALLVVELIGIKRPQSGDTLTELWRHVNRRLPPWFAWGFRIFTIGLLVWAVLHFIVGAS